jgi:hypothetical protein
MSAIYTPPGNNDAPQPDPVGGMDERNEAALRDQIVTANTAATQIETAMSAQLEDFPARELSPEIRDTYAQFTRQLATSIGAAEEASHEAFRTLMDDMIAPDGRKRLAKEAIDNATNEAAERQSETTGALQVLEAQLESEAIGTPERRREQLARDEAAMLIDRADNPVDAMIRLATDPDPDLRAVVAGPWGRRYLESTGTKDAAQLHAGNVRPKAIGAAIRHGATPESRAAAAAYQQVGRLRAASGAAISASRARLRPFTR